VSHSQQLLRLDEEEISLGNGKIRKRIAELVEANLSKCNAIVLSDYGKGLLQCEEMTQILISAGKERNIPIIIDPKGTDWERYRGATCVTPNIKELEMVCGHTLANNEQLLQAIRSILIKYNLTWLVVTRGPLGICVMNQNDAPIFIPALARQVYDVSGAGDTVVATLSLAVASGLTFPDAAKLGNLAAGIVVGKIGTQPISLLELQASLETSGVETSTSGLTYKIASLSGALIQVKAWRANRQKVVFTNGCFDLLHPGHIRLLNQAKGLGDRLVVAVNSDASVARLKGPGRPILAERDRASLIASLDCVDLVLVFEPDTPEDLLRALKPDVLAKGADYKPEEVVGREIIESYGGYVRLIPLLDGYSTTDITNRLLDAHRNLESKSGGR
jgi:D-beta-D-heptose 7-phosphate kinase/D-beta-D-heptose 1-phosphate adenosyltransferase